MSKPVSEQERCADLARILHDTLAYDTEAAAAWFHETAREDPCKACEDIALAIAAARAEAVKAERAAVIAYLRNLASGDGGMGGAYERLYQFASGYVTEVADEIERGEHIRGDSK